MASSGFAFRPLARGDFSLLATWLGAPHIHQWWQEDYDPAAIEARYGPVVDGTDPGEVFVVVGDGQPIGLLQLPATLLERRIAAVGATLFADLRQPLWIDGQAEQTITIRTQTGGQFELVEIIVGQRIVGGADAVMQGHVEAGRRLAGA